MANNIYNDLINCLYDLNIYEGVVINFGDLGNDVLIENGFDDILKSSDENITKLSFKENSVDIIICHEILENLRRKKSGRAAMEMKRVCKQDGCICVVVPAKKENNNEQHLLRDDMLDHFFPLDIASEKLCSDKLILIFINEK